MPINTCPIQGKSDLCTYQLRDALYWQALCRCAVYPQGQSCWRISLFPLTFIPIPPIGRNKDIISLLPPTSGTTGDWLFLAQEQRLFCRAQQSNQSSVSNCKGKIAWVSFCYCSSSCYTVSLYHCPWPPLYSRGDPTTKEAPAALCRLL